jgi:hypothetical protein
MSEFVPYDELQNELRAAVEVLDAASAAPEDRPTEAPLVAKALRATLLAVAEGMGECREELPYAPMHPVRTSDGKFRWCCTHDPEHCGADSDQ